MDKRFFLFAAVPFLTLAACATSRVDSNPQLANWAGQYGYKPYVILGQSKYCHDSVGASGSFCLSEAEMANLMAHNQAPRLPPNSGGVETDSQAGR